MIIFERIRGLGEGEVSEPEQGLPACNFHFHFLREAHGGRTLSEFFQL